MASQLKPFKPWGVRGPNPPKIIMLLEELGLPYEPVDIPFADLKQPPFLAINPNGRMPAFEDPNADDLAIWESGAIIEYLVERYDKDHRISFPAGSKEAALARQWLFFQVSGQGPYYGQAVWFTKFHTEKLPSAVDRYVKEINRVTSVLESHLAKQKGNVAEAGESGDGPWLVGGRVSYADISFVPWQAFVPRMFSKEQYDEAAYPNVKKWLDNLRARPAVSKALEMAAAGQ